MIGRHSRFGHDRIWRFGMVVVLGAAVAACNGFAQLNVPLPGVGATDTLGSDALTGDPVLANADLERAPDVFQAAGIAQWDGKRTARGVWIAHPKVPRSMDVRIVLAGSGVEIDGRAYRSSNADAGDVIALSSDTAMALGLKPGQRTRLGLFALKPRKDAVPAQRKRVEITAASELSTHVGTMSHSDLLQLIAASMRGMGYATTFEKTPDRRDMIRAFPKAAPQAGLPPVSIDVRARGDGPVTAADMSSFRRSLSRSGDVGLIVSIDGYEVGLSREAVQEGTYAETVDLGGVIDLWTAQYEFLSEVDQNLLRLEPVYFLAGR